MRVCMAEMGNAQMHRCVYHGWAFRPDGSCVDAPIEREHSDTWPHMSRNARGAMGRQQTMKYGAPLEERKPEEWPEGGLVYDGFTKDDTQWNWWLYYRELMTAKS
jgi:phenylpropionate dioxygenase-like ring-hydroxylating dioxygenase large terminal subunit